MSYQGFAHKTGCTGNQYRGLFFHSQINNFNQGKVFRNKKRLFKTVKDLI
jgi:hypothetical protein